MTLKHYQRGRDEEKKHIKEGWKCKDVTNTDNIL